MRILFSIEGLGNLRYFERAIRLLAGRGDEIHIAADRVRDLDRQRVPEMLERLIDEHPGAITFGPAPGPTDGGGWAVLVDRMRAGVNYVAYREPPFEDAPKLRERMETLAPGLLVAIARRVGRRGRRLLRRVLEAAIRSAPNHREIERLLGEYSPDLLLAMPRQPETIFNEYIRVGRNLGVATGFSVRSWDNLTMKGLLQEAPDFTLVWNEGQREEAIEIHGLPAETILLTGGPAFDHWFEWQPSRARPDFCQQIGLSPERPFVLYLGSSQAVGGSAELDFVDRWLAAIRARGEAKLGDLQVLIRPHPGDDPARQKRWRHLAKQHDGVALQAIEGKPTSKDLREDFFDSMYHSAAVVGVNTSAMIESAIVGRPVLTLLDPELRESQEGLPHFSLLSRYAAGVLTTAPDFEEHARQLARALDGEDQGEAQVLRDRFVEAFVRPRGLDKPATEAWVEAIDEGLAQPRRSPARSPVVGPALRALMGPLAYFAGRRIERRDLGELYAAPKRG